MCICYNWVAEGAERQALAGDVSSSWGLRRHSETCAGCIVSWITCISLLPRIDITICPSQKRYEKRYDRAKASGRLYPIARQKWKGRVSFFQNSYEGKRRDADSAKRDYTSVAPICVGF